MAQQRNRVKTVERHFSEGYFINHWKGGQKSEYRVVPELVNPDVWEHLDDIAQHGLMHGIDQKINDKHSSKDLTVAESREVSDEVWDNLKAGIWNAGREVGGILAEAVAELMAKRAGGRAKADDYIDEARRRVKSMDDDTKKKFQKDKVVAQQVAEIRLRRAKAAAKDAGEDNNLLDNLLATVKTDEDAAA